MRIQVEERNKVKLFLWLPSWLWIVNELLKHVQFEGQKLSVIQRKKLISAMKITKKYHRFVLDINIYSHDGTSVIVKI